MEPCGTPQLIGMYWPLGRMIVRFSRYSCVILSKYGLVFAFQAAVTILSQRAELKAFLISIVSIAAKLLCAYDVFYFL